MEKEEEKGKEKEFCLLFETELRDGMAKDTDAVSHSNAMVSHGQIVMGRREVWVDEKCD